ncbi:hypothetical protein [Paenibacillus larvae]|uniref:Uncharacterized protein n=1 Tax=Paenibacillus larvae subsp. larvae TaxID=147375 RepID=A0A2L1U3T8_9BACL|nr:hypothetical protein [Paenibacillus larvae]AQZ45577.1 hypothetical protein B5S25_02165 [Paenibacillus larvae subsp. pulvifaciens]AVF27093.1 hypothetical protein ERICIII_02966 [Paenibacillus larvae subsp. larvae]AVF27576.1 hypothetical protein ERICIII_03466 [Paenibacillus larvae subsp. larvae]MBH0344018.1 hypothetical protein [Paenibacillus larvae]MCY7520890.1 hypothetical protein [Paenibacillus larvae]
MLVFAYISFLIYGGLVLGTYLKFMENGVRIARRSFLPVLLLPFIIICLHTISVIRYMREERTFVLRLVVFPITNFPLIVGLFIELLLEKQAQVVASKKSINKTHRASKKNRSINKARGTVGFDFNVIKDAAFLYNKKLIPKEIS